MNEICIFCNTGHYIEIFETQLDIAQRHLDQGDKVSFFVCDGTIPGCEINYTKDLNTCLYCISRRNNGFSNLKGNIKKYGISNFTTLEDILSVRNLNLKFNNLQELKNFTIDGFKIGFSVFSSIADIHRQYEPCLNKYKKEINVLLKSSYRVFLSFKNFLEKKKPKMVYLFNGRHALEQPIIKLCEENNITYFTHESAYNGGYFLSKNTQPQDLDGFISRCEQYWNDDKVSTDEKKRMGNLFFKNNLGIRQGRVSISKKDNADHVELNKISSMDKIKFEKKLPTGWEPEKENIIIFQSSIFEEAVVPELYQHSTVYGDQLSGIKKILSDAYSYNPDVKFYLRLHPSFNFWNNKTQELELFKSLSSGFPNLEIINPDEGHCSYFMMENASKVVSFRSTTAMEAAYRKVPSIVLEDHLVAKFNCVYKPKNHQEVMQLILDKDLKPLDSDDYLKFGYYQLKYGIIPKYYQRHPEKSYEENWTYFRGKKIEPSIFIKYIIKGFEKRRLKTFYDTFNGINLLILDFLFKFKLR